MKPKYIVLLTVLALGVVILLLGLKWAFKPVMKTVDTVKPDFIFEASAILNEFEEDEQAANNLYLGKIIQVHGTIDNIADAGTMVIITLKDPDSFSGVSCSFDRSIVISRNIKAGTNITVKGICAGYLMDVVLTKCAIVEKE